MLDALTSVFASVLACEAASELFGADAAVRGLVPKSMMTMPGAVPLKMLSRLSARDWGGSADVAAWLDTISAIKPKDRLTQFERYDIDEVSWLVWRVLPEPHVYRK